jgi:hypothetical protein
MLTICDRAVQLHKHKFQMFFWLIWRCDLWLQHRSLHAISLCCALSEIIIELSASNKKFDISFLGFTRIDAPIRDQQTFTMIIKFILILKSYGLVS